MGCLERLRDRSRMLKGSVNGDGGRSAAGLTGGDVCACLGYGACDVCDGDVGGRVLGGLGVGVVVMVVMPEHLVWRVVDQGVVHRWRCWKEWRLQEWRVEVCWQ